MKTETDYREKYINDIAYILEQLEILQTVTNKLHSVAIKQNVNIDTIETLTIIKQSLDMFVNIIKDRTKLEEKTND